MEENNVKKSLRELTLEEMTELIKNSQKISELAKSRHLELYSKITNHYICFGFNDEEILLSVTSSKKLESPADKNMFAVGNIKTNEISFHYLPTEDVKEKEGAMYISENLSVLASYYTKFSYSTEEVKEKVQFLIDMLKISFDLENKKQK